MLEMEVEVEGPGARPCMSRSPRSPRSPGLANSSGISSAQERRNPRAEPAFLKTKKRQGCCAMSKISLVILHNAKYCVLIEIIISTRHRAPYGALCVGYAIPTTFQRSSDLNSKNLAQKLLEILDLVRFVYVDLNRFCD